MGRVFKPEYTKPDGQGGRVRVQVKDWYVEYTDHTGKQVRKKVGRDKRTADSALAKFQDQAARKRLGLPDLHAEAELRNRELSALVQEYLTELADRGTSEGYRTEVERNLNAAIADRCWRVWSDLNEGGLRKFLARKKNENSPATANAHLRSAKGFANWYSSRINEHSPFKNIKSFNEQVDRRRSRRVLTDGELDKLIAAAKTAPRRHKCIINGGLRAALYFVAAHTGLRASELASLEPDSFALDAEPPVVIVEAKHAKGRRSEPVPLSEELVAFLRVWLDGRRGKLWPGKWAEHKRQVRWVERDAKRAGLGKGVTFHSLRRQFVTRLIRSGADVDEVRRLARHKSAKTTLDHYAESKLADLAKTVNRTKRLG